MNLKEVLQKLVDEGNSALLNDGDKISNAGDLLDTLSDLTLNRKAHLQPGLYKITFSIPGQRFKQWVEIEAGKLTFMAISADSESSY